MRKENVSINLWQRLGALLLAAVMVVGMVPTTGFADISSNGADNAEAVTWADPETLTRPGDIYGDNTLNAGKVTVGKSVMGYTPENEGVLEVNGQQIMLSDEDNFLITISQSAQVMGLASQSDVPVDVVFVLDTSGSMNQNGVDRATSMVDAANSAIATLMETNDQNRVAVVAFSDEGNGGGTSGNKAASVLSSLAHYDGEAATNHLQWVNYQGSTTGNNRNYIAGRDRATYQNRTVNAFRDGHDGGTNIQAGIAKGAQILTAVQDTTWTNPETNETVTRIPFLIILSDGQPTYSYDDATWYAPNTDADQQGPGSDAYEGNGFIAALTAAYYKGKITEHYYGESANAENHCFVYTMGVQIDSLSGDEKALAQITLDPATYTTGTYAQANEASYWNYGNTWDSNSWNRDSDYGWKTYWNNYQAGTAFTVRVDNNDTYTFTAASITASKDYVDGVGYTGGLAYNDDYFAADDVADMEAIFEALIRTIQEKAISVPTKVTTGDHDFDGYVTFTDPIGEYMEVKDVKGVVADGKFYQGASFARLLRQFGTNTNPEFDTLLMEVLETRMSLTESVVDVQEFIEQAVASPNQAYWNSNEDFDNSIVWWGNIFNSSEEDEQVQVLGFADNDTIEYITDEDTVIPEGADYVCRSYFFYGTAGDLGDPTANHEYMYFMVRVQRELTAPYRETVVISAPASLLSMEKVLITETFDDNGNAVYTASVEPQEPARVVYEVGLWDSITAENVSTVVSDTYENTTVNGEGQVNYDPDTDTYYFFTNDWDRSQTLESHHRAMAKATFDAAADNAFYTYQEDTLIVDANGNAVTSNPAGTTAYYVREYYDWANAAENADGTYTAVKKTELIKVDIPAGTALIEGTDGWYIPKGAYTAATLIVNGDDVKKTENTTNTSEIVAHPERTGDVNNSHYTVYLGNNGVLSLVSDPPVPEKTVTKVEGTTIVDADGKAVMVGDVLTYTVKAENYGATTATVTVTDTVPAGTAYVANSANLGGVYDAATGTITWTLSNMAPGEVREVSFQVTVTEEALNNTMVVDTINNTATVQLGDNEYHTNTTTNPPEGKKVTIQGGEADGSVQVGDVLLYSIEFHNDTGAVAETMTIVDTLPTGTTFVSADHNGVYDAEKHTVTWTFTDVAVGAGGVVTFTVVVDASAKTPIENGATITIGDHEHKTNTTSTELELGNLVLNKTLVVPEGLDPKAETFTLTLTDPTGKLSGTYSGVEFVNGVATVEIVPGTPVTIQGLPAGVTILVSETVPAGFSASITNNGQAVITANGTASVAVTNTYAVSPLTVTLEGDKELTGTSPDDETFGFTVVPCDEDGVPTGATGITGEVTLTKGTEAITFGTLTFTAPGTYHYLVSEINGGEHGVTYSTVQYLVTIVVEDNGEGKLVQKSLTLKSRANSEAAFAGVTGSAVIFTNHYDPVDTSITLAGEKTLTGRDLKDGEFSFVVHELDKDDNVIVDASGNPVIIATGTNDENGKITFRPITYTQAGSHKYVISEVTGSLKGVDYTDVSYTITVDVVDKDGILVATVKVATVKDADGEVIDPANFASTFTFENVFTPDEVEAVLEGTKTLTGRDPNAGEFSFVVLEGETVVVSANNGYDENDDGQITGDELGKIVFAPIGYDLAKFQAADTDNDGVATFTYTVKELVPTEGVDPNLYYDPAVFTVTVTVTYSGETGLLSVTNIAYSDTPVFENIQNPATVTAIPEGYKSTSGNFPAGTKFSFSVTDMDGNLVDTGISDANGKITFSGITYDSDDLVTNPTVFQYWITEDQGGDTHAGIAYDGTKYKMVVTLSRNDTNKLETNVEYFSLKENGDAAKAEDYTVKVTNPAENVKFSNTYSVTAGTKVTMQVEKNLLNRDLGDLKFEFGLYHVDGGQETLVMTATNDQSGLVEFTREYAANVMPTGADTRVIYYVIRELPNNIHGVDYENAVNNPIYVKVTLTDNLDGTMSKKVEYSSDGETYAETVLTFTNTYTPDPILVNLEASKSLVNEKGNKLTLEGGEFSFVVIDNATGEEVAWATNAADGSITFSNLEYTFADAGKTFTYTVKEVKPDTGADPNLYYDPAEFAVTVTVTYDESTGKLGKVITYPADMTFDNIQNPAEVAFAPTGTKTTKGSSLPEGLRFSFRVYSLDKDGNHVLEGTGMSQGTDGTDESVNTIVFTDLVVTDEEYAAADTDGDGYATFTYYIEESNAASGNGVDYDEALYRYEVVITRTATKELVVSSYSYAKWDADTNSWIAVNAPTFNNTYNAQAHIDLTAGKSTGGTFTLTDNAFDFRLQRLDQAGKPVAGSAVNGTNTSAGAVNFATLNFSTEMLTAYTAVTEGETTVWYVDYLMSEIEPATAAIPGVEYDKSLYIVTIKLTQTADAKLSAALSGVYKAVDDQDGTYSHGEAISGFTSDGKTAVTFTNTYEVRQGTGVTMTVSKYLENRVGMGGMTFEFGLYHNGNLVATATNDGTGTVTFTRDYAANLFEENDTDGDGIVVIEYEIRELDNNIHGVDYTAALDKPIYVKVTVKDDGKGGMELVGVEYSYDKQNYAEDILTFTNTYTPDPILVNLEATKSLVGRDLKAGEFSFVVLDGDKEVAWATNDADGNIVFSNIEYTFADAGKTFTYTVKEVKPDTGVEPSLYYDPAVFTVSVTVTYDESTGLLDYEITYPADMEFNNVQNPATISVTPVGSKSTTGNFPDGTKFSFSVVEVGTNIAIAGGNSGANGDITFSSIPYDYSDAGQTFYYWIVEDRGGETHAGITYDDAKYLMVVSVGLGEKDALTTTVAYYTVAEGGDPKDEANWSSATVAFVNEYNVTEDITVDMSVDKVLNGRHMQNGEFSFGLYHITTDEDGNIVLGSDGKPEETLVATATNQGGTASFAREYSANVLQGESSRVIYYVIRELYNGLGGVNYEEALDNPIYVKVTVTDNEDGTMSKNVEYFSDLSFDEAKKITDPTFTNYYDTGDTTYKPVVNKILNGRDQKNDEFSFVVTDITDPDNHKVVSTGLSKAADMGQPGVIDFTEISYAAAGTYKYMIAEVKGNLVNMDYDQALANPIYLMVTVVDDQKGSLVVDSFGYYTDKDCTQEITGTATFTNTYTPIGTTAYLKANKTLTGRAAIDGEFSFQVKDASGTVVATGGNYDGVIKFSGIGINAEGEYIFSIVELDTQQGAVDFDPVNTYYAKVTVVNNPEKGELEIKSIGYYSDAQCTESVENVTYVNVYDPDEVSVSIPVHKTLVNKTLNAGDFVFELYDSKTGDLIAEITNDEYGNAVFENIAALTYDVSDLEGMTPDENNVRTRIFTYIIIEKANTVTSDNGTYFYDDTKYYVTVTLTDDGSGVLTTNVVITVADATAADPEPVDAVTFTNSFTPNPIEVDLDTAIGATKTIVDTEGNVLTRDDVIFKFVVTDLYGNEITSGTAKGEDTVNGVIPIDFGTFKFSAPGEYRYLITESTETLDGYVLDTAICCTHIQVRYDIDTGLLSVSDDDVYAHILTVESHADDGIASQADEPPAFVNVYDADDVHLHLTLDKELTGDRTTVKEHEFAFQLLNEDGTIAAEGRNHADGTVNFYLDYTLQDLNGEIQRTYEYTVKEVIPEDAVLVDGKYVLDGITYDTTLRYVTVVLTDNGKGELEITVNGSAVAGEIPFDTGIVFENKYTAADVTVAFHALKRMEGMPLEDDIYTFQLKDGDEIVAEGTNKADGTIVFDKELTFTEPGTYTYTMVEYKGSKPGVTFDATSFTVTVEVTDNGKGNLEAKVTYTTDEGTYDLPVFINIYQPTGAFVVISADKDLNGRDLEKNEFTFQLLDSEGNVVSEGKNAADGTITFERQHFEEVGTHTYTIVEVIPEEAVDNGDGTYTLNGVTYSNVVYTVVVEITDPGFDGTLDKKITYYLGDKAVAPEDVIFTNDYSTTDSNEIVIEGTKVLEHKDLEEKLYSFVLKDSTGKVLQTVTHDADGKFTFEALKYTFEDMDGETEKVFTYTVSEVKGTDKNVTYDETVYTVTVTVTDDGEGTLTAAAVITGGADDGKITFTNIYTNPITVKLEGSKELTGRDQKTGEFDFEVRDADGNLVTTGTNNADGTIDFVDIVVENEMDLILHVTEVKGSDNTIVYDGYTYRVRLTVTNDNGVLEATVTYVDGEIVFYNEYEAPETPDTGDDTPVIIYTGMMAISALALSALLLLGRKKKERKFF